MSTAPTRNWTAAAAAGLARGAAAVGAIAAHGEDQRDVDRDDDYRRGDEADLEQSVDLVSARRVRRQSAAILITLGRLNGRRAHRLPPCRRLPILADLMKRRSRPSPALRTGRAGRGDRLRRRRDRGAAAAPAPADPGPGDRRRLRRRAAGPRRSLPALEEARRRPLRDADVGLHHGPRDSLRRPGAPARPPAQPLPDRQRPRDRRRQAARTPACSGGWRGCRGSGVVDRVLTWTHWLWFFEPYVALALVLARNNERFPRAARQMAAVFDLGCAVYFAVPTAPPWWASEEGLTGEEVRRIMVEVGEDTWGSAWPKMYDALGGNPWAAMPSLHFATSLVAALSLAEVGKVEGALGWAYAGTLGFAPRLPRRALRHRPPRRERRWWPSSGAASRWRSRSCTASAAACAGWSAWPAGSVPGVSGEDPANGNGTAEMPLLTTRRLVQTVVVVVLLLGRHLLPLPEAGRPRRRAEQARRGRSALDRRSRSASTSSPTRPTSPSSRRWSAATRCG